MERSAFCKECVDAWMKKGVAKEEIEQRMATSWKPINSYPIHKWQCPEGHTNFAWLSAPFYDLLYSKALTDLARLDTRSAVLNFYSAWENFVSDTVDLLLKKAGASSTIPSILSRSEPRLGMYVGLYAAKTQVLPPLPDEKSTRMSRNKIVHDNMIPTENEAIEVGCDIRDCMLKAIEGLHPLHQEYAVGQDAMSRQQEAVEKAEIVPHNIQYVFMGSQIQFDIKEKIQLIREEDNFNSE